jgi:inner membrane protein
MSSFLGHSIAGATVYFSSVGWQSDRVDRVRVFNLPWLLWLVIIAAIPDLDYLLPNLILRHQNYRLRTTHSLLGVAIVPVITILGLWLWGQRGKVLKLHGIQAILAGLSHLLLDLGVGVFPLPLLYPNLSVFKLPFGLLPSAGRIQLTNYLFYRNLGIELGAIVPLAISMILIGRDRQLLGKHKLIIWSCLSISIYFMNWAFHLSR